MKKDAVGLSLRKDAKITTTNKVAAVISIIIAYAAIIVGLDTVPLVVLGIRSSLARPGVDIVLWSNFAILTASSICTVILGIPLGILIPKLSIKKVFSVALFVGLVAGILSGFAKNIQMFVFARFLFGLAFIMAEIAYVNIVDLYFENRVTKTRVFALLNTANMIVNVLSGLIAGLFDIYDHWRFVSAFISIMGIALPIVLFFVKEPVFVVKKAINSEKKVISSGLLGLLSLCIGEVVFVIMMSVVLINTTSVAKIFSHRHALAGELILTMWLMAAIVSGLHRVFFPRVSSAAMYVFGMVLAGIGVGVIAFKVCNHYGALYLLFSGYGVFGVGIGLMYSNCILYFYQFGLDRIQHIVPGINMTLMGLGYLVAPFVIKIVENAFGNVFSFFYCYVALFVVLINVVFSAKKILST